MALTDNEGYVPTLGEYAAVIDWLWTERHDSSPEHGTYGQPRNRRSGVPTTEMPPGIRRAFGDALHRATLRRMAAVLEAQGGEGDHAE